MSTLRCHLCMKPGREWCQGRDIIECNYIARLRLGIPEWQAKRLRAEEWSVAIERKQAA